jgi:hypothetical protein
MMWMRLADAGITPQELEKAKDEVADEDEIRPQSAVRSAHDRRR